MQFSHNSREIHFFNFYFIFTTFRMLRCAIRGQEAARRRVAGALRGHQRNVESSNCSADSIKEANHELQGTSHLRSSQVANRWSQHCISPTRSSSAKVCTLHGARSLYIPLRVIRVRLCELVSTYREQAWFCRIRREHINVSFTTYE